MTLPPFPVDNQTLDLIQEAMECGPDKPNSDLYSLLQVYSQMAGSDTDAVIETEGNISKMRDPQYTERDIIEALIDEVRRLREVFTRLKENG